jgi:Lon protease-like protein
VDKKSGSGQADVVFDEDSPLRSRRSRKGTPSTQPDKQSEALAYEQRRAAADAIAAIAKATTHHDDVAVDQVAVAEQSVAETAAELVIEGAELAAETTEFAELAAVDTVAEPVTVVTPRPRRRRAASRPAGPPAGASAEPAAAEG